MAERRVLIMGAAGRDFHNFNTVYRDDPRTEVVAFTATQIPFIDDRRYPAELAGPNYPEGIQIYDESELTRLIRELEVDDVVFSYSDVSHEYVMHKAQRGARGRRQLRAARARRHDDPGDGPHRGGDGGAHRRREEPDDAGDRRRAQGGREEGRRGPSSDALRGPRSAAVQRYADLEDLDRYDCTIEEREEYEPHITSGTVIYAGVDYGAILEQAQAEADVLLWDGGNNDLPFYTPDVWITLVDPLRVGHELTYHPGRRTCARRTWSS